MSYTPTNWNTGDTITASAMNKIENGIANAGGSNWDAVIRLTHANNSGADTSTNLTPSIVSGTFADLSAKIANNGCPCILVEYWHLMWGVGYAIGMAYISESNSTFISMPIAGYSIIDGYTEQFGILEWTSSNTLAWR